MAKSYHHFGEVKIWEVLKHRSIGQKRERERERERQREKGKNWNLKYKNIGCRKMCMLIISRIPR